MDLTEYVERHEFVFDAVLDEGVSNEEVSIFTDFNLTSIWPVTCFHHRYINIIGVLSERGACRSIDF